MPRQRDSEKPAKPDDQVRLVVRMPRDERAKLKGFAARVGEDMEDIARRWLMERVAQEEKRLAR